MSVRAIVSGPEPIKPATALRYAALCVLGLAATWVAASLVPASHAQDAIALKDFTELSHPSVDLVANSILALLNPALYTLWALAILALALVRGRPRVALALAVVLPLAPLSTEVLKPLLAHPHLHLPGAVVGAASWPSGHSTAAMTLVLAAVLASPRQARVRVAALGSAFAIAAGFSLLVLAWHLPSDVFGGYLLAALWSSLAIAMLAFAEQRWPSKQPRDRAFSRTADLGRWLSDAAGALLAAAGVFALAAALAFSVRHRHLAVFAVDHRALVIAAAGIATLAVAITSTLAATLRR
jgi:membrane-associated phospholipid phosphatase